MKVSIIIPSFRSALTIEKTLRSIASQTFLPYEVIVILNGPLDESESIIKNFKNVKCYIQSEASRPSARNTGARIATGDVLAFVDSDVELTPNWLESAISCFEENSFVDIVCTSVIPYVSTNSNFLEGFRFKYRKWISNGTFLSMYKPFRDDTYLIHPFVNTAACLYHKKLFDIAGGFDPDFFREEDIELSLRAFYSGGCIYACQKSVAYVHTGLYGESWLRYMLRFVEIGKSSVLFKNKWNMHKPMLSFGRVFMFYRATKSISYALMAFGSNLLHVSSYHYYNLLNSFFYNQKKPVKSIFKYAILKNLSISSSSHEVSPYARFLVTDDTVVVTFIKNGQRINLNIKDYNILGFLNKEKINEVDLQKLKDAGLFGSGF